MSSSVYSRLGRIFSNYGPCTKSRISLPSAKSVVNHPQEPESVSLPSAKPAINHPQGPESEDWKKLKKCVRKYKKFSLSGETLSKFESFIVRLAKAEAYSLIDDFLQTQKTHKNITDEAFTVQLIILYGKAGMFDHARKVFDEMPELKCERTVMSVNALLTACLHCREYNRVYDLFKELLASLNVEPNHITWNTVINSFCRSGKLEDALLILDEMDRRGTDPNVITFNTLINAFYKNDRFEDCEKMWKMMAERKVCPTISSYNSKLQALASKEMMEEAVELIGELRTKGLQPDGISYNALIRGFCDVGNLEEAKRWYDEMWKSEVFPDRVTFAVLVPFLCKKGDFDAALGLCKDVFKLKLVVDAEKMQHVVDGLVMESKIEEATELVELGKANRYCYSKLVLPDNMTPLHPVSDDIIS